MLISICVRYMVLIDLPFFRKKKVGLLIEIPFVSIFVFFF
jgi:hypothetical protein